MDRLLDYTRDNAVEELLAFLVSLVLYSRVASAQRRCRSTRARKGGEPPFVRCTQKRGIFCRAALRHTSHRGLPPPWLARVVLRIQKTQPNLRVSFALILAFGQRGSTSMTIVVNEKQASHIHLTMSIATFETTVGTFKAELYTAQMPITWYVR